jgi:hypothetical protein
MLALPAPGDSVTVTGRDTRSKSYAVLKCPEGETYGSPG